jgi:chemosensory pili system protein ChpA (sensor histidine kinase/response regulator)
MNILVVEDSRATRKYLALLLTNDGHYVTAVADGKQALSYLVTTVPDLVITDLIMPAMDGYEMVKQLRKLPGRQQVPVVMITAADLALIDKHLAAALRELPQLGPFHLLEKPAGPEDILKIVRSYCAIQNPPASAAGQG